MFEFAQLRSFIAVAEELHFGRAAARLHMSQPPLSRQIILLEHQVGVRLFVRNNRRVELTLAGRAFLPEARRLLKLAESAIRSARRVACGEVGQVTISFTASAGYDFLPPILRRLREELPGVECILKEMVSIDQLDALEAREVDIALLRPPVRRAGLEDERVSRETLIVAIPSTHRLSEMVTVSLAEVAEEKMVTYSAPEGRYFNELMNRLFAPAGITPELDRGGESGPHGAGSRQGRPRHRLCAGGRAQAALRRRQVPGAGSRAALLRRFAFSLAARQRQSGASEGARRHRRSAPARAVRHRAAVKAGARSLT